MITKKFTQGSKNRKSNFSTFVPFASFLVKTILSPSVAALPRQDPRGKRNGSAHAGYPEEKLKSHKNHGAA
jgi:hypothetical protein